MQRSVADFSRMKISELIAFAEQKAEAEKESPPSPDTSATWADTLEVLRAMKEHGVPDSLKENDPVSL
jgi:hypothetical protein